MNSRFTDIDDMEIDMNNIITQCNYSIIEDLNTNTQDLLQSIMHINIHSLPAKHEQLQTIIRRLQNRNINLEYILLCETFLNNNNQHLYKIEDYTLENRNRCTNNRGGVAIYIRNDITYKRRTDLEFNIDGQFESIFIETIGSKTKTIVGEVYRIPNTNEIESLNRYDYILNKLQTETTNIILGTDQNFDLLKIDINRNTCTLLDNFLVAGLIPMINKPTRVVHTTSTLIDNIYTNINTSQHIDRTSTVLVTDISDHYPVLVTYKKPTHNKILPIKIKTRKLDERKLHNINQSLKNCNWDFIYQDDIESSFQNFINKINEVINLNAPEV